MSRPEINLFRVDLKPRLEPLTGPHLVIAGAAVAVLLLVLAAMPLVQRLSIGGDLAELQAQVQDEQAKTASFRQRYRSIDPDPALQQSLLTLQEDRDKTAAWLSLVAVEDGANRRGFASYLSGLADHHVPGLWLTTISLAAGGAEVSLAGRTTEPAHLPKYLGNLGASADFAGKAFRAFQMDAPDANGALRFVVSTEAPPGASTTAPQVVAVGSR